MRQFKNYIVKQFILLLFLTFGLYLNTCQGQTPFQFTATHLGGNSYKFEADLEPLTPLGGAVHDPFYSYYIDFGDGHFKQGHMADFEAR